MQIFMLMLDAEMPYYTQLKNGLDDYSWLFYSTLSPNISIRRSVRGETLQEIHKLSINLSHCSLDILNSE